MPEETRPGSGEQAKQYALGRLRDTILRGGMAPAQRLVETELAAQYGVTRASIRAALLDLASEGLVERIRNRGSRVRVVTIEEAVEITECRMALEALCAAKAAEIATDAQIDELADLGEAMSEAVAGGDPVSYSDLNHDLHTLIRVVSGQRTAVALLERLNAQLVRHRFRLALRPGRAKQSLSEHLAVIEAISARDPRAAEGAVRAHLSSVIDALRDD
ncbi:FCD domain-containing protein [Streptomyces sp. NPDC008125]|uniref:GntR family transcriptional regulator n=1 Tax=Streptomyces sp. NPDC008125 TaxID=3364811 RepID=UPI0036E606ED